MACREAGILDGAIVGGVEGAHASSATTVNAFTARVENFAAIVDLSCGCVGGPPLLVSRGILLMIAFLNFFVETLGLVVEALVGDWGIARLIAFVSPASFVHYFLERRAEPGGTDPTCAVILVRERHFCRCWARGLDSPVGNSSMRIQRGRSRAGDEVQGTLSGWRLLSIIEPQYKHKSAILVVHLEGFDSIYEPWK